MGRTCDARKEIASGCPGRLGGVPGLQAHYGTSRAPSGRAGCFGREGTLAICPGGARAGIRGATLGLEPPLRAIETLNLNRGSSITRSIPSARDGGLQPRESGNWHCYRHNAS
jgi:hypothetical protein